MYNKIKTKYGEEYVEDQFARSTSSWKSEGDNPFKEDQNNADLFNADLNKLNEQIKALQDLDAANDKTQDTKTEYQWVGIQRKHSKHAKNA